MSPIDPSLNPACHPSLTPLATFFTPALHPSLIYCFSPLVDPNLPQFAPCFPPLIDPCFPPPAHRCAVAKSASVRCLTTSYFAPLPAPAAAPVPDPDSNLTLTVSLPPWPLSLPLPLFWPLSHCPSPWPLSPCPCPPPVRCTTWWPGPTACGAWSASKSPMITTSSRWAGRPEAPGPMPSPLSNPLFVLIPAAIYPLEQVGTPL